MKLFLKILIGFVVLIGLLIGTLYVSAKRGAKTGPMAPPLASLSTDDFQAAIDAVATERRLTGMVGRVDVGGETIAEAATGLRVRGGDATLGTDDLFHIGSIGKSMSATVIATLVEDGTMRWSDTLGQALPDIAMHDAWRDVTISQLLTHTGSIAPIPIRDMINSVSEPVRLREVRREVAGRILQDPPETEPGTTFAYSNAGYMLASIMAEEATGERWETLVRTRMAEPLGLETLGFGAPTGETAPWGHNSVFGIRISNDPAKGADNPPFMAAAGTMHIGLEDLMRYARAHIVAGQSETALLDPATFETLHTPVLNEYAYGWVVQSADLGDGEEPIIWHNGSNTIWYALLMLLPERDAAIIIATNDGHNLGGTQKRFDQLAREIAKEIAARGI